MPYFEEKINKNEKLKNKKKIIVMIYIILPENDNVKASNKTDKTVNPNTGIDY